jgi:hypothetical protein
VKPFGNFQRNSRDRFAFSEERNTKYCHRILDISKCFLSLIPHHKYATQNFRKILNISLSLALVLTTFLNGSFSVCLIGS